mgnify:CR=1 FL=1
MSDVDLLMDLDPLSLADADIDAIVAYHRNIRAKKAAGEKPTKPKVDVSSAVSSILNKIKPAAETKPVRRI